MLTREEEEGYAASTRPLLVKHTTCLEIGPGLLAVRLESTSSTADVLLHTLRCRLVEQGASQAASSPRAAQ